MRILIFHGYLLGGTGSNVYNARLAAALAGLGHEVHLLCQDRHPQRAPFVDAAGDWDGGALRMQALTDGPARCTVYRPNIGELLPVYVEDRYEGMQARTFSQCSEEELRRYLQANVQAVREVVALAKPQIALANHLVMGPVILARALGGQVPYAVKAHGSALEYTVKPDPTRFLPFAREGIAAASGVLVGSRHTAESLWEALGSDWVGEHDLRSHTRLGPPGVDVHAFRPRDREQARAGLRSLARRLGGAEARGGRLGGAKARGCRLGGAEARGGRLGGARTQARRLGGAGAQGRGADGEPADGFARDETQAARALACLDRSQGPIVAYVGKLIVSKGVDLLLAAWPLVLEQAPNARLAIVGFGAFQAPLEEMTADLAAGRLDALAAIAAAGRALEGGPAQPLRRLQAFLGALRREGEGRYLAAAAGLARSVSFTGRLDHDELADLLPACEAVVVPSTFPEAFGMVAVEAAACGALPISAGHSGLAEVSERLAAAVGAPAADWLSFPVDDQAVQAIAQRLIGWLGATQEIREAARAAMVATVDRLWSWDGVAEGVIAAAQGRLEQLPAP